MNSISNKMMPGWATFLFSFVFLFFMACEEGDESNINFEEDEQSAYEAEESVENLFDIVESITNSAIRHSEANSGGRVAENSDPELACAVVSFNGTLQNGRLEINFGEGCEGPDGKVRKGIIVVEYEGYWLTTGSIIWTVFNEFYIDGVKIEGVRKKTNTSLDLETLVYTVEIHEGKVIWPDETFLTREGVRTHTLIFGDSHDDFELHVEGTASGMTRLGVEYSSETIEPLIFKSSCRGNTIYLPVSGIKTITIHEKPVITVNYGEGECDKTFRVSIGGGSKEVTL